MIMGGDRKKLAGIIVSKIGGNKDEDGKKANEEAFQTMAGEPEVPQVDEGLLSAAEEVQAAFQGEPARLAEALQNFFYLCGNTPKVEAEGEESNPLLG